MADRRTQIMRNGVCKTLQFSVYLFQIGAAPLEVFVQSLDTVVRFPARSDVPQKCVESMPLALPDRGNGQLYGKLVPIPMDCCDLAQLIEYLTLAGLQ